MKRYISFILMICLIGTLMVGCGKEEKKEKKQAIPLTIYEQLTIKDTPLSDDDSKVIENGINNWVKGFLAVNSNTDDKELSDKILYQSVVNQEQREKLEKDRDAFYKNGGIVVEETTTKISNTKKAEYQKKEVGVVDCETTVKGTANGEAFEKKYTMQMVVKRDENDVVTVYEINSITWE